MLVMGCLPVVPCAACVLSKECIVPSNVGHRTDVSLRAKWLEPLTFAQSVSNRFCWYQHAMLIVTAHLFHR